MSDTEEEQQTGEAAKAVPSPSRQQGSRNIFARIFVIAVVGYLLGWVVITSYTMLLLGSPFLFIKLGYIHLTWNVMALSALLFLIGIIMRLRTKWQPGGLILGVVLFIGLGAAGLRFYATHWAPEQLQVKQVSFESPKITKPLKVLHISDFQADHIKEYERLALKMMAQLEPDIILHTGDLLHPIFPATPASEIGKLRPILEEIKPPLGIYHVMGDTDGMLRGLAAERGISLSELTGTTVIQSEEAVIELDGFSSAEGENRSVNLRIFGLVLQQSRFQEFSDLLIDTWWEDVKASGGENDLTILMGHAPDYILWSDDLPIDLCLAGHTHGGQIRIPGFGPLYWSSQIPRSMARGLHERGKTRINVSAGVGAEHAYDLPAIRFFCPPEMTLITILPEK